MAVTSHLDEDEVAEPTLRDALLGERLLRARQRDADDVAAEGLGRADRESPPQPKPMSSSRVVRLRTMRCFVIERKWHVACHGRFVFDSARRAGRGSFVFCLLCCPATRDPDAPRARALTNCGSRVTHTPKQLC